MREQREAACCVGHGFVGDCGDPAFHQAFGLVGIGSEVEIGEEDLPFAKLDPLVRLRLLDLHHHLGAREDFFGAVDDACAHGAVIIVGLADPQSGTGLDDDIMSAHDVFARCLGRQADAVFVVLDFLGDADKHDSLLGMRGMRTRYSMRGKVSIETNGVALAFLLCEEGHAIPIKETRP